MVTSSFKKKIQPSANTKVIILIIFDQNADLYGRSNFFFPKMKFKIGDLNSKCSVDQESRSFSEKRIVSRKKIKKYVFFFFFFQRWEKSLSYINK